MDCYIEEKKKQRIIEILVVSDLLLQQLTHTLILQVRLLVSCRTIVRGALICKEPFIVQIVTDLFMRF